jgi:hypothetical protein
LGRYFYTLKAKETGLWKKILTAAAVVAILAVAAVATVFTCGVGGVVIGGALAGAMAAGGAAVLGSLATIGIVAGSVLTAAVTAGIIENEIVKGRQKRNKRAAQAVKGRNEHIPEGYERKEKDESRKLT